MSGICAMKRATCSWAMCSPPAAASRNPSRHTKVFGSVRLRENSKNTHPGSALTACAYDADSSFHASSRSSRIGELHGDEDHLLLSFGGRWGVRARGWHARALPDRSVPPRPGRHYAGAMTPEPGDAAPSRDLSGHAGVRSVMDTLRAAPRDARGAPPAARRAHREGRRRGAGRHPRRDRQQPGLRLDDATTATCSRCSCSPPAATGSTPTRSPPWPASRASSRPTRLRAHHTGFAIGGVAPVGHPEHLRTIIDVTLGRYATVWAAAGHSHSVFATTYDELIRITGGQPMDVA